MTSGPGREVPLRGGRTSRNVVRIGDRVHRPPTPNSDFVGRLLDHLHIVSFRLAPRAWGTDDLGRDVLDFIPGDVPADLAFHADHVLRSSGLLIRRFHDATASLVDSAAARRVGFEVVCHNDLSPCNFVFVDRIPIAIIDFDAAAPGARVQDLAYAAWLWLDLGSPDVAAAEQGRRLSVFLDAYGPCGTTRADLVRVVLERQASAIARGHQTGQVDLSAWAETCRGWTLHHRGILEA